MSNERIEQVFQEAAQALEQFRANADNLNRIAQGAELMIESLHAGGKLISCGNGGSMCDAMHFAEELSGRFRNDRPALAALSISDPSHISCVANDFGYDYVFSRYIEAVGKAGDVLLAISTSGNSRNVVKAAEVARTMGMAVVALTGKDGGQLAALADVEIRAPHSPYADRAQEIHIKVIHALIDQIEQGMYAGRK
jgi:D-sedoheptulose 7-phosphate isomerase